MDVTLTQVQSILTRTSGYLADVASHSLQPYQGCSFGNSLCGVGCYVRHNQFLTRGREWGSFLEVRTNAAEVYRQQYKAERAWARKRNREFCIFMSSATDPFLPHERKYGISKSVLSFMYDSPPDVLILQTHSADVSTHLGLLGELARHCKLRVHLSIETDRESIADLPAHGSPIDKRFAAAAEIRAAGIQTIIAVAPLLPIENPQQFFARIAELADGVILDHYIGGDGSSNGARTAKTLLPIAMAQVQPDSVNLSYLDEMATVARSVMPGRVGIGQEGFAGIFQ